MNLDLVGRDPTADRVGMSTGIISAARAGVGSVVSLQLIELVHLPVTGHTRGRGAHAALSTSGVWCVGHQLSTVLSGTCPGPTVGEAERANLRSECRGVARPVGSMRTAVATRPHGQFQRCVVDVADVTVGQAARIHRGLSPPGPHWPGQRIWSASWGIE